MDQFVNGINVPYIARVKINNVHTGNPNPNKLHGTPADEEVEGCIIPVDVPCLEVEMVSVLPDRPPSALDVLIEWICESLR